MKEIFTDPQVVAAFTGFVATFIALLATAAGAALRVAYKEFSPVVLLFLNEYIEDRRLQFIKDTARTVVRSLRQSPAFQNFSGEELFKYAASYLDEQANKRGYDFDPELLAHIIEEAVRDMKNELGEDMALAEMIDFIEGKDE